MVVRLTLQWMEPTLTNNFGLSSGLPVVAAQSCLKLWRRIVISCMIPCDVRQTNFIGGGKTLYKIGYKYFQRKCFTFFIE